MSISTFIKAYTPDTDLELQKHKKVLEFCKEMGVSLPTETFAYFNVRVEDFGVHQEIQHVIDSVVQVPLKNGEHYVSYREKYYAGYEVDLTKLPQGVTKLRFLQG